MVLLGKNVWLLLFNLLEIFIHFHLFEQLCGAESKPDTVFVSLFKWVLTVSLMCVIIFYCHSFYSYALMQNGCTEF